MSFAETPYMVILICKTNLGNIKVVILEGTGYYETDFIYKIIQKILWCTKNANPVIVFNNEQNEYCIVCYTDTDEMQKKYKEWINIDFDVFSKINSTTPIKLKPKPEQDPYLRIVGSNTNTSSISNPSNISILSNTSNQFALNANAKPFVPKARRNLKL